MLFNGYTPEWLYRILPTIYATSGIAVIVALQNAWALFSGTMLVSAAALIVHLRRTHRREQEEAARLTKAERSMANVMQPRETAPDAHLLVWERSYETGHELIDRQHRDLFASCNALLRAVASDAPRGEIDPMLDHLVAAVERHFRTEESVLAGKLPDEAWQAHRDKHESLAREASEVIDAFRQGRTECRDAVGFLVSDMIAMHVISENRLIASA